MTQYFGKYRGKVTDNVDLEKLGQLEVSVPSVLGEVKRWALPCVPYAGPKVGLFMLPPIGANVWVEFEAGDPEYPIWTGCFWGKNELPVPRSVPDIRLYQTEGATLSISKVEEGGLKKGVALKVEEPLVQKPLTLMLTGEGIEINNDNKTVAKLTAEELHLKCQKSEASLKGDGIELKNGGTTEKLTANSVDLKTGSAEIQMSASGVNVKNGGQAIALSAASVSINNGALEVI